MRFFSLATFAALVLTGQANGYFNSFYNRNTLNANQTNWGNPFAIPTFEGGFGNNHDNSFEVSEWPFNGGLVKNFRNNAPFNAIHRTLNGITNAIPSLGDETFLPSSGTRYNSYQALWPSTSQIFIAKKLNSNYQNPFSNFLIPFRFQSLIIPDYRLTYRSTPKILPFNPWSTTKIFPTIKKNQAVQIGKQQEPFHFVQPTNFVKQGLQVQGHDLGLLGQLLTKQLSFLEQPPVKPVSIPSVSTKITNPLMKPPTSMGSILFSVILKNPGNYDFNPGKFSEPVVSVRPTRHEEFEIKLKPQASKPVTTISFIPLQSSFKNEHDNHLKLGQQSDNSKQPNIIEKLPTLTPSNNINLFVAFTSRDLKQPDLNKGNTSVPKNLLKPMQLEDYKRQSKPQSNITFEVTLMLSLQPNQSKEPSKYGELQTHSQTETIDTTFLEPNRNEANINLQSSELEKTLRKLKQQSRPKLNKGGLQFLDILTQLISPVDLISSLQSNWQIGKHEGENIYTPTLNPDSLKETSRNSVSLIISSTERNPKQPGELDVNREKQSFLQQDLPKDFITVLGNKGNQLIETPNLTVMLSALRSKFKPAERLQSNSSAQIPTPDFQTSTPKRGAFHNEHTSKSPENLNTFLETSTESSSSIENLIFTLLPKISKNSEPNVKLKEFGNRIQSNQSEVSANQLQTDSNITHSFKPIWHAQPYQTDKPKKQTHQLQGNGQNVWASDRSFLLSTGSSTENDSENSLYWTPTDNLLSQPALSSDPIQSEEGANISKSAKLFEVLKPPILSSADRPSSKSPSNTAESLPFQVTEKDNIIFTEDDSTQSLTTPILISPRPSSTSKLEHSTSLMSSSQKSKTMSPMLESVNSVENLDSKLHQHLKIIPSKTHGSN